MPVGARFLRLLRCFLPAVLGATAIAAENPYFPPRGEWEVGAADAASVHPDALAEAMAFARDHHSASVLVIRGGRIAAEEYWAADSADTRHTIYSVGKPIISTLIGIALQEQAITNLDQGIETWLPRWKRDGPSITVRHLLTMTSGLVFSEYYPIPAGVDQHAYLSLLPQEFPPGTHWRYDTQVYRLLYRLLEVSTGEPLPQYMTTRLTQPLGMADADWETKRDGLKNYTFLRMTARDLARFGLMALRGGLWGGRQVVPAGYLAQASHTSQEFNPSYGLLWWVNGAPNYDTPRGFAGQSWIWPDAPADAFAGLGAFGIKLYVIPSRDLVIVRMGEAPTDPPMNVGADSWDNRFLALVSKAFEPLR